MALDYCPNGCGERLPRREVSHNGYTLYIDCMTACFVTVNLGPIVMVDYNSDIYHSTDDQAYKNSVYSSKRMYLQGLGVHLQGTLTY